jgi:hypothetical protein
MRDPSGYGQIRLESTCPAALPAAQGKEHTMAEITEREQRQIDQANSSGKTPVVFIHGLWLLPSSWDNWVGLFEENGYAGVTPSWPDDPEAVEEARANPEVFARKTLKQVADHTAKVISANSGMPTSAPPRSICKGSIPRRSSPLCTPAARR